MPTRPRLLGPMVALAVLAAVAAGCSSSRVPTVDRSSGVGPSQVDSSSSSPPTAPDGSPVLAQGTCWSGTTVGADPQDVLALSKRSGVPYLAAARAVADR